MKRLALGVMVLAALAMAACGGSSSSSGPKFGGSTSKVAIAGGIDGNEADVLELAAEGIDMVVTRDFDFDFTPFLDMVLDDEGPFRQANFSAENEITFDGSCGGSYTEGMKEAWSEEAAGFAWSFYVIADNYCNEEPPGLPTFGGTVNGRVERSLSTNGLEDSDKYKFIDSIVAKNWTEFYPAPEPESAVLDMPAVDMKFRVDGKAVFSCTGCHEGPEPMAFAPAENPLEVSEINFFAELTEGEETRGVRYNLKAVYSEEEVVMLAPAADGPPPWGWDVTGTACDYEFGCVSVETEELLGDAYCCEYDVDYGVVVLDGAGDADARVTFMQPEPQYLVQLWDSEAGDWEEPGTEYTSYYEPYIP